MAVIQYWWMQTILKLIRRGRRWYGEDISNYFKEHGGWAAVFVWHSCHLFSIQDIWDTGNVLLWSSWIRTLKRTLKERSMTNWPVAETSDSNTSSWAAESCDWLARSTRLRLSSDVHSTCLSLQCHMLFKVGNCLYRLPCISISAFICTWLHAGNVPQCVKGA